MPAVVAAGTDRRAPGDTDAAPAVHRRRLPWRTAVAALGGLALLLAFPDHDLAPAAVLGPAALALAVHGQRVRGGLWLGLVLGGFFLVPLLSWTGTYVGAVPWLALAGWQATYYALLGGALALTSRLPAWPVWGAALWVADEALRARWFLGGFPWGRLGFSQAEGPFTALAAYGGVPLVGFAVALTGGLLAAAVLAAARWRRESRADPPASRAAATRRPRALRAVAGWTAAAVLVPVVGWLAGWPLAGPSLTDGGPTVTVAVVQGNVPRAGLDFNAQRRAVLDNHVEGTLALAAAVAAGEQDRPDLVVWPENSSDIDPYQNADAARAIGRAAAAIGAPILVGAVVEGPGRFISNTTIVWDPVTGPGQTYVKRHPVPLAEYVPAREFFRFFSDKVDLVRRDMVAGSAVGTLQVAGTRIGDLICFEVAYDHLLADLMADDATADDATAAGGPADGDVAAAPGMLVVQTNNATFGYTDESAQQVAMGRLRAVEYGRTVVMSSTSGISAIIAPDGSLAESSGLYTADLFVEDIAQRDQTTLAQRLGAGPEWVLVGLAVGAVLLSVLPLTRARARMAGGRGRAGERRPR